MTRLLVFLTLAYIFGIALGAYLPLQTWIYVAVGAFLWALWNLMAQRNTLWSLIPFLLLFLAAGSLAYTFAVDQAGGNIQPYHEQRCTLNGMVADEPLWHDDRVVFPLKLNSIQVREERKAATGTVRVTLYRDGEADAALAYGQVVSVRGLLVVPEGKRNPGGFDYRAFLETRGMAAAFYGEANSLVSGGFSEGLSPVRLLALELKDKMKAVLQTHLPPDAGGLLVAILFGERQALDPGVEEGVRRSGVAHMMAVSGLHIGLLAALLFVLFKRVGLVGWPAWLLLVSILFAYTYLTGLKPSTLRAFIMIAMGVGALCLGRSKDLPTAVAVAALFTLVYNPLLLFHVGMQLSYGATLSILLFAGPLQQAIALALTRLPVSVFPSTWQDNLGGLIAVSIAAQIGILPLIGHYFKEVSLLALPANVLILPVMALLLGIGLVCAVVGLLMPAIAAFLTLTAYPLLAYILFVTGVLGSLPFAVREVFPPRPLEIFIYYSIILFVVWKGGKIRQFLSSLTPYLNLRVRAFYLLALLLIIAMPFSWWGLPRLQERPLEVVFLDVGQGDAVFMHTPGGMNILLDGGGRPAYMEDIERVGRMVVIPFLEERRVRKLDMVIVSHPHEDHYGGLLAVLDKIPVELLVTNAELVDTESYNRLLTLAEAQGIPRLILERGDVLPLEPSLKINVLCPPARLFQGTGSDVNNNSLVMQLLYRDVSFLFTGDIEDAAVRWMLAENLLEGSQILKVPHHGGYMDRFSFFLEAVNPQIAVIQVGRNSFGHPHDMIFSLLQEQCPEVYRTDWYGAVMMYSDGYSLEVKTMLQKAQAWTKKAELRRELVRRIIPNLNVLLNMPMLRHDQLTAGGCGQPPAVN